MLLNVVAAPTTTDANDTHVPRSSLKREKRKWSVKKKQLGKHGQYTAPQHPRPKRQRNDDEDTTQQLKGYDLDDLDYYDVHRSRPARSPAHHGIATMDSDSDAALDSEQEHDVLAAVQAVMRREGTLGKGGGGGSGRPTIPVGVDYDSSDEDAHHTPGSTPQIGNNILDAHSHNNTHTPSAARAVAALDAAPAPAVAAANAAAARRAAKKQAKKLAKQQQRRTKQPGMMMPHMRDLVHVGGAMHGGSVEEKGQGEQREEKEEKEKETQGEEEDIDKKARSAAMTANAPHTPKATLTTTTSTYHNNNDNHKNNNQQSFECIGISSALASHLEECNFTRPSAIQARAIPAVLTNKDVLINAATGSGKTLCYLAPIIDRMASLEPRITRKDGTLCLIVAPTRELVLQIQAVMALLLRRFAFLVGGVLLGGENRNHEKRRLRKGINLLVATPGRLLDHLQSTEAFGIHKLQWLVLDEADRLLDMGFRERLGTILSIIDTRTAAVNTPRRQTVLLSATLGQDVLSLASLSLQQPLEVSMGQPQGGSHQRGMHQGAAAGGGEEGEGRGNKGGSVQQEHRGVGGAQAPTYTLPLGLKQHYVEAPCKLRLVTLAALLARCTAAAPRTAKVVVFVSACACVEFTHRLLGEVLGDLPGCGTLFKLHGLLSQAERTASFVAFNRAPRGVLLCTDVAARGLDFPSVTHIIQYDPPGGASEYVHRVGRTARAGAHGQAMLVLQPHELGYLNELQGVGVGGLEPLPLELLLDGLVPRAVRGPRGSLVRGRSLESHEGAYRLQMRVLDAVGGDPGLKRLAVDAFRSFVRAYATHPLSIRHVFDIKKLHLGHVAHAFGLKDPPGLLGASSTKKKLTQRKRTDRRAS